MMSQCGGHQQRRDHLSTPGLAVVAAAIVFAGFARTYCVETFSESRPPPAAPSFARSPVLPPGLCSCLVLLFINTMTYCLLL